ncbi:methyltransferase regulatory domain-containing protein [Helicobacter ganmani]|uniref:methyltransferase regulatory domain-containing protein n=2 Tax=Helicobacter ganmani TaxID=60246 RepID=UPI003A8913F0
MESYGYATELEYVDDFIPALNPLWIDFSLTLAGVECPKPQGKFRYLELGFGLGNSLTLHASCSEGEFMGNDFIPAHCQHAQKFIAASQSYTQVYEEDFLGFYKRLLQENRKFDYIILHGVWSWVSRENQEVIFEIINHCLDLGGVVYVSYNVFPGWEGKYSLRHLLKTYESNASGNQEKRIQQTISWAKDFFASSSLYAQQNPRTQEIYQELQTREINYLCHEFFNKDWHCLFFSQMAESMRQISCEFSTSAKLMWHFDPQTFSAQQKVLLAEARDSILQEQLKDYWINESFRMDCFVRGKRNLTQQERTKRLLQTHFVLLKSPFGFQNLPETPLEFQTLCQKILDFFAKDSYQPKTLQSLVQNFGLEMEFLLPIVCAMMTQGFLHPAQAYSHRISIQAKAHNQVLFSQKPKNTGLFLASASIGRGIFLDTITWNCLKGYIQGNYKKESLAEFVKCEIPNLPKESLENLVERFLRDIPLYQVLGILD